VESAETVGVHFSVIVDAEGGHVTTSLPVLCNLAHVLDLSVAHLGCFD